MARPRAHGTGSVHPDRSRGEGHWKVSVEAGWTRAGTRRRITRRVTGTKRQADQLLLQLMREAEADQAASPTTTVKAWADDWLEIHVARVRPHAFATDRSAVRRWIVPTIGAKRLTHITPGDLRAISKAILTAGLAPATAQRTHAVAVKMLRDALLEGYRVPPRIFEMDAPSRGKSAREDIPLEEAVKVLAAASRRADASRWVAAMLQGMRPAECRGLTWACVDFEERVLDISWQLKPLPYLTPRDRSSGFRVPVGFEARHLVGAYHLVRPKTAAGKRIIPLVPWMTEALRVWRDAGPRSPYDLVWPEPDGRPLNDKRDRQQWRALLAEAGVDTPHDLYSCRHTTATLLDEAGVDSTTITAIMGHASILSTRPYRHTDQKRLRAAIEGLAATLALPSQPAG